MKGGSGVKIIPTHSGWSLEMHLIHIPVHMRYTQCGAGQPYSGQVTGVLYDQALRVELWSRLQAMDPESRFLHPCCWIQDASLQFDSIGLVSGNTSDSHPSSHVLHPPVQKIRNFNNGHARHLQECNFHTGKGPCRIQRVHPWLRAIV